MRKLVLGTVATAILAGSTLGALAVENKKVVDTGESFKVLNSTGRPLLSIKLKHGDKWGDNILGADVLDAGKWVKVTTHDTSTCDFPVQVEYKSMKGNTEKWNVPHANLCKIAILELYLDGGKLMWRSKK